MPCRWMHDSEIGRWWYPQCFGGIYGREGCTCPRGTKAKQDQVTILERRIDELERRLDGLAPSNGRAMMRVLVTGGRSFEEWSKVHRLLTYTMQATASPSILSRGAVMPKRIQRQRSKGWKMPPNTVYVGRPSIYGNPYIISPDCQHLSWFREDLVKEAGSIGGPTDKNHEWSEHFWRMSRSLYLIKGKNLACWCLPDQRCHADILLELANAPALPNGDR